MSHTIHMPMWCFNCIVLGAVIFGIVTPAILRALAARLKRLLKS